MENPELVFFPRWPPSSLFGRLCGAPFVDSKKGKVGLKMRRPLKWQRLPVGFPLKPSTFGVPKEDTFEGTPFVGLKRAKRTT